MSDINSNMVITAVGPDRPGLVKELSSAIRDAGANLEDARMAILGGEFALLLLVTGSGEAIRALTAQKSSLEDKLGLNLTLKPTERAKPARDYLPYRLRVSGFDRPGIVSRVSTILAGRSINVASFESRVTYAPLSGTPMFMLEAELQVPSQTALSELRQELTRTCDEENLDFSLEAARG